MTDKETLEKVELAARRTAEHYLSTKYNTTDAGAGVVVGLAFKLFAYAIGRIICETCYGLGLVRDGEHLFPCPKCHPSSDTVPPSASEQAETVATPPSSAPLSSPLRDPSPGDL